ncbi:hypothetical protein JD510_19050 [Acinetobacter pittii]|uniref:hypothetical protein n=1 Tax=Acinetobacter pittii TaxID=48296 RepID=UPI000838C5EA|nr:hypothetical protein [Acinetobacter pittii]MBK0408600.1 hypothetical protein [Acinetobacter pittii]MCK0889933.1 hypothetical protein [Acinetobacter pittii]OCY70343.1 hypothetical protein BFR86_14595 [Acinetobacter pittii]OCY75100.1 hypothetical protein BFR87_16490 [Acinetobacter pittii]OCY76015.1 hypothetical protein BFR88_14275 [Acinetobacter pittii]
MKPEQFIREYGVEKARDLLDQLHKLGCPDDMKITVINGMWQRTSNGFTYPELKRLVESFDLIEKLGGYGKCKFYMTGMKLNKCDSVKCPKTGLIVSRAALEIAINDYRESIYGGGDE